MASGDTLVVLTPLHNEPPSSSYATLDLRNNHPVLDFDAGSDESAVFSAIMPRNYWGNGVTIRIHYAMSSTTSGVIDWDTTFERIGDQVQDIDSDGFTTVNTNSGTVPGTSGHVGVVEIPFTDGADMDSVGAGESFRLKVTRDANAVSDTATGDAELLFVEIKET